MNLFQTKSLTKLAVTLAAILATLGGMLFAMDAPEADIVTDYQDSLALHTTVSLQVVDTKPMRLYDYFAKFDRKTNEKIDKALTNFFAKTEAKYDDPKELEAVYFAIAKKVASFEDRYDTTKALHAVIQHIKYRILYRLERVAYVNNLDINTKVNALGYRSNIIHWYSDGLGLRLVDDKMRTLYVFGNDSEGVSTCYDGCEAARPVYYGGENKELGFGIIEREDGKMQTTYMGRPLYYYAPDSDKYETKGHDLNNRFVADHALEYLDLE